MYQAEKVKIDLAMAEKYMAMHKLTKSEFSQKMGHSHNWWHGVIRNGGYIMPAKAKLMCSLLGMEYNQFVIPAHSAAPKNEQKSIREEDENLLKALVNCLNRIEKKVDEAAIDMTRMEIQMRTILKELGVK